MLLDNGKSYFEKYLTNFGARKFGWRYFNSNDFINPYQQYSFGFLSCFSLESRFGFFGKFFDYTLYIFDLFLSKITSHPTVILTVPLCQDTCPLSNLSIQTKAGGGK